MTHDDGINRSGGGIVFGDAAGAPTEVPHDPAGVIRGLRRRWASGIVVVTTDTGEHRFRGITVTSFMVVSEDPALVAIAVVAGGEFADQARAGAVFGISVLDARHEFPAERFAGRAPLPDSRFTGIAHRLEHGAPVLADALAWCVGRVRNRLETGDHLLLVLDVEHGGLGPDTDDPLLRFEGRYRRLEAG